MSDKQGNWRTNSQRGMSIFIVAAGLTFLLGITGLAIDLATLYVARNEAQRAADAAALAGAQEIFSSGYASGLVDATIAAPLAATQASKVGNQNLILGQNADLDPSNFNAAGCPPPDPGDSGGCFDFTTYPNDPQITVVVRKQMPTYFMGIFGIKSVPVSAVAKAEVYVPEGAGPGSAISCAKPWLTANCDPAFGGDSSDPEINTSCPCTSGMPCFNSILALNGNPQYTDYFVDPTTLKPVHPGVKPTGSIGEFMQVKTGNPTLNLTASQFNPVFFPGASSASPPTYTCPSCAANDQQNSTSNSAALYSENIECCSSVTITCGSTPIEPIQGNMVGPTDSGVACLIHQKNSGKGQDCISLDSSNSCGTPVNIALPFTIYAGSNNPYPNFTAGSVIPTSDSLVTMPLYDGQALCPGNSCPASVSVNVQGYLTVFITNESAGSVSAYVTGVTPCGGNGGGGGAPIPAAPGNPVPIRLIH
jgi:hypothetical protein